MEVPASHIHARYPTHATRGSITIPCRLRVRDFHPLWCAVPGRLPLPRRRQRWPTPHIPQRFPNAVRFVLFRVHSPLLTEFLLISFPPPTKMLQFGGFPFLERNGTMCQEVPFGNSRIQEIHASPRDLSQLVTTFFGSRAEPSPSRVVASGSIVVHSIPHLW